MAVIRTGEGPRDRLRWSHHQALAGQRCQGHLVVVLQEDGDVPATYYGDDLQDSR